MREVGEMFKFGDLVVGKVEHTQVRVALQTREIRDGIVREVELFEVLKVRETGDTSEAVRLNGDDAEVGKSIQILYTMLVNTCIAGESRRRADSPSFP